MVARGAGVVYKLDPAGHYRVLHAFVGGTDGSNPYAGLTLDAAGNLYGTTQNGGGGNGCGYLGCGAVFKVDAAGQETILHRFTLGTDGIGPQSGLLLGPDGDFYGTTYQGGAMELGTVYKLDAAGNETVLYSFPESYGGYPSPGNLISDAQGNLYGTTAGGSSDSLAALGVVYKLDTLGEETVLYTFAGGAAGSQPQAGVIRDGEGNFYGTAGGGVAGAGIVYKLDSAGRETLLYSFGGRGGYQAYAGVFCDAAGNLYGTNSEGGSDGGGTAYMLEAAGTYRVLHSFAGGADGSGPLAGLIRDDAGNLYGTTEFGGAAGAGVVYRVDLAGHETVLYSFTGFADGGYPTAGVISDSAGNLYGTTSYGAGGGGVVYKLNPSGQQSVLHTFTAGAGGFGPYAGVVADPSGNLYGTTAFGGGGEGVVYRLDPAGNESVMRDFKGGGSDSGMPTAGVTRDAQGNLYGTSNYDGPGAGDVYKLDAAGNYMLLHSFTSGADGGHPDAGVVLDAQGNLYGTTYNGGASGMGVVYKLDPSGAETVLYAFKGGADGGNPYGPVTFDAAGNIYGTTTAGGTSGVGVIFKLTPQ